MLTYGYYEILKILLRQISPLVISTCSLSPWVVSSRFQREPQSWGQTRESTLEDFPSSLAKRVPGNVFREELFPVSAGFVDPNLPVCARVSSFAEVLCLCGSYWLVKKYGAAILTDCKQHHHWDQQVPWWPLMTDGHVRPNCRDRWVRLSFERPKSHQVSTLWK